MEGPFNAEWSAKDALDYLRGTREKLELMRQREAIIKRDLGVFSISQPDSLELIKLEKDLAAIELVWELTQQWNESWERYKHGNFWTIETEEMELNAQTLFR